jgi:GDP-D-mannose dehydratase
MLVTVNPIPRAHYNIWIFFLYSWQHVGSPYFPFVYKDVITVECELDRFRPLDADLQIPNTTKFREHTGWEPIISFERTMQDLLNYWRIRIRSGKSFLTR